MNMFCTESSIIGLYQFPIIFFKKIYALQQSHRRRIAVGYDSGNGVMTAWRFGAPGEHEKIWHREQNQAGHMIVLPDTGELVSYDYDHERGTEQCVVLDIESGAEKGRVALNSPLQSVVFPAFGGNRDVYITTFATISRVFVE